jgi:hypothetical protein
MNNPSPRIERVFLGEPHVFSLDMAGARLLEAKFDMGVLWLEALFRQNFCKVDHIESVLKHALIGGGMDEDKAHKMVTQAVDAGAILRYVELSHAILCVFLGPFDDDEEEEPEEAPKKTRRRKADRS